MAARDGDARTVTRPERYFADERGVLLAEASLRHALPEVLAETHGADGARERLRASAEKHEENTREEAKGKGWRFLGRDRVLSTSPYRRATAFEELGGRQPTFATKGGGREAFFEAVEERRSFEGRYREALGRWVAGDREAVFHYGTWRMCVRHGVRCAAGP